MLLFMQVLWKLPNPPQIQTCDLVLVQYETASPISDQNTVSTHVKHCQIHKTPSTNDVLVFTQVLWKLLNPPQIRTSTLMRK